MCVDVLCFEIATDNGGKLIMRPSAIEAWKKKLQWLTARIEAIDDDRFVRDHELLVVIGVEIGRETFRRVICQRLDEESPSSLMLNKRLRTAITMLFVHELMREMDPLAFVVHAASTNETKWKRPLCVRRRTVKTFLRDPIPWCDWRRRLVAFTTCTLETCKAHCRVKLVERRKSCSWCSSIANEMSTCSGCNMLFYCSSECQTNDWNAKHRFNCERLRREALHPDNQYDPIVV